jgi:predicted DNA-binding transcriptional regulator YafY
LREYSVRSFAQEYKVSEETARRYLNSLVKLGKAAAVEKPLRIYIYGKEVETKRKVTIYKVNGHTQGGCPDCGPSNHGGYDKVYN